MKAARRPVAPRPRPLLWPAIGLIVGIWLSESSGPLPLIWRAALFALPFVLLAAGVALRRRLRSRTALALGLLVLALPVGMLRHQAAARRPADHVVHLLGDEPVLTRVAGHVVSTPVTRPGEKRNPYLPFDAPPRTVFVVALDELRTTDAPAPLSGNVRVTVEAEQLGCGLGDAVVLTGRLYRPGGGHNPGGVDWARVLRYQGIDAGLTVESAAHVRVEPRSPSAWLRLAAGLRGWAHGLLFDAHAGQEADDTTRVLQAMVLGQRSATDRRIDEAFLRTGTVHFLTVSGFHVGVLAVSAFWLARTLTRRRRVAACVTIAVILLYAVLAEPNAPILRASLMGVLACVALLLRRPVCPLNWLSLAALLVLALNPLELFRAGFQLSFVQVLALITVVPWLYGSFQGLFRKEGEVPRDPETIPALAWSKLWPPVLGLVIVCLCAWALSLPLVMLHFGRYAPMGAFQSMLISPLVVLVVALGFLTLVVSAVVPPAGVPLNAMLQGLTGLLLSVVEWLGGGPNALVEIARPPGWAVIATYAILSVALLFRLRRPAATTDDTDGEQPRPPRWDRWVRWPVIGLVALAWWQQPWQPAPDGPALHVLAVGSGSAAVLVTPQRGAVLFDAGTIANFDVGRTVVDALRALGVERLDALLISHANFDHFSGTDTVLAHYPMDRVLTNTYFADAGGSVTQLLERLPSPSPQLATLRAGDRLAAGAGWIEVLWPPDDLDARWPPNDRSLVLRVEIGRERVLVPGDIEGDAMRALLERHREGQVDLRAEALIAPHHGAVIRDTEEFYRAVSPRTVIVSTAKLRPKLRELVRTALDPDCRVLSTRDVGAVQVSADADGRLRVRAPYAAERRRS